MSDADRKLPVYLNHREDPERLAVKIGRNDKAPKSAFNETLARVKSVPGRRWNPEDKTWDFPFDAETALRIMRMVEPMADAEVQTLVQAHQAEIAEAIVTAIGDDAVLCHAALNQLLFPYQRAYVDWGQRHPRSILGDEMGIGKTIQTYGVWREAQDRALLGKDGPGSPLTEEQAKYPLLVVAPNDLRGNWADELRHGPRTESGEVIYDYWPAATVQVLDGSNIGVRRKQLSADVEAFIVNWEKLRGDDAELLGKQKWGAVIASQTERAKNKDAKQTQGLWKLDAPLKLPETGSTLMPNELWPLLRWLQPDQYAQHHPGGGYWPFHYSYVDDYATKRGRVVMGIKNVDQLRFELRDKFVRRTKKQVLPDLPDKLPPKIIPVDFTPAERKLYDEAAKALFLDVQAFADQQEDPEATMAELEGASLASLSRRIPNGGARITALRQITGMAKARVAVNRVLDNAEQPLVVFTWYVEAARWIVSQLSDYHVGLIAGDADASAESKLFQQGEYQHIVCTISKSQGFNLYRSHHAIFADQDWEPDKNKEALDRLHRQGQKSDVSHDILRVPGTVDDGKVAPKIAFKSGLKTELWGSA